MRRRSTTELIDRYEESLAAGSPLSPEDLCQDCPELLGEVKEQIRAMEALCWLRQPSTSFHGPPSQGPSGVTTSPLGTVAWLRPGVEPVPGFRLMKVLGRGGFGEVWLATAPGGFQVAFKFVRLGQEAVRNEQRSLGLIRNVRHPHLLTLFGAWRLGDVLAVAMELADCTLQDRYQAVTQGGTSGIPLEELLPYMRDAAAGLDHLNASGAGASSPKVGIQHRDVKPANLVLVGGQVKVADFGLVRPLTDAGAEHTGGMTAAYAPPEFFEGRIHRNSDQYALAVTYCLLRGGRLPFEGSAAQVMAGHLHHAPNLAMLPATERPVVTRALAKDPDRRWPDCVSFVAALLAAGQQPASSESIPSWGSSLTGFRWAGAMVGLVLLITVAVSARWAFTPSPPAPQPAQPGPDPWPEDVAETDPEPEVRISPSLSEHATRLHSKGLAHGKAKRYAQAVENYTAALQLDPAFAAAYLDRADAYLHVRELDRSVADCDAALRLLPEGERGQVALAYARRGNAYRHLGRADQAIADYTASLKHAPGSGKVHYFRGLAYAMKGNQRQAQRDKEAGIRLGFKPR